MLVCKSVKNSEVKIALSHAVGSRTKGPEKNFSLFGYRAKNSRKKRRHGQSENCLFLCLRHVRELHFSFLDLCTFYTFPYEIQNHFYVFILFKFYFSKRYNRVHNQGFWCFLGNFKYPCQDNFVEMYFSFETLCQSGAGLEF